MRYPAAVVVLLALFLVSCAGLPEPQGASDSLVIGSLVLDFPDGFFNEAPRRIDSRVWVDILNKTQGTRFAVSTMDGGYFYFLSNGSDEYSIDSYSFQERSTHDVSFNGKISSPVFTAGPRSVQYIGHLTLRFRHPKLVKSADSRSPTYWHFDVSSTVDKMPDEVLLYLKKAKPDSAWVAYEIQSLEAFPRNGD